MLRYTIRRVIMVVPVVLGVMLIVFLFQAISKEDPAAELLGPGATPQEMDQKREELGLNDPIVIQYARYVWNFVSKGDLGTSYSSGRPVINDLINRYPVTIRLALSAVMLAVIIGIPLGVISAVKQYTLVDSGVLAFAVAAASIPNFWFGLMLISLFSVRLRWLPSIGISSSLGWIMPTIVVMVNAMANFIRNTRSSMLESIRQDYVRMARAKGLRETTVIIRHAFRNSLIPIINIIGNALGIQLGGALIVETVFGLPGIGKYAIDSISTRNFPAVRGSVVLLAITFTLVNLFVDLIFTVADPRIKTALYGARKKKAPAPVVKVGGAKADG